MKDWFIEHKKGLLWSGLLVLGFLIGLALPSPFFRNKTKTVVVSHVEEYVNTTDTIDMAVDGGLYSGTISRKTLKRNGQGQFKKGGSVYEGEWVDDKLEYGKRTQSVSVYTGHFDDNLNNDGFGIVQYNDVYIGKKLSEGLPDSEIIVKYIGNWSKDSKHGLGRAIKKDGSMDFGIYSNGVLQKAKDAKFRVGGNVYGIDVSHWQKKVDWDNLALYCDEHGKVYDGSPKEKTFMQPVFFVYIKATQGASIIDSTYYDKVNEAKKHGMVKGAYHYLSWQSSVEDQLKNFFETVTWVPGDLPPALDVEWADDIVKEYGADTLQSMTLEWLEEVEKKMGVRPIIYTRENIRDNYLKDPKFNTYQFWISRYLSLGGPDNSDWLIWQKTESAKIRGCRDDINVDIDIYQGNYDSFERYLKAIVREKP